ncbi:MAG: deoxyribodipyrimidine photolyase [Gammaproteobacteria bacterium CG_4_10_14_0_8_um_filter_38_16]|nr:MAG: deoxyribodipyrimidine photolyase [Gammaproteobacteria bacterium CG_4_10_14_0_8_um_filter_38_16]PJA03771.1 MAG: deoxyribodipyrimidine photolyase [Gammaproteobacteria bacterium CG_4_10_14_0_2_um_filter_38_22]PJB10382.1 MAG: deoxyribodipyrimidine photolyase [Gammaproteobacteria bacterium CG_4_9_14_3_um_filter_38_9]
MNKYIVWFQQDLRLADNPALFKAASAGVVLPIYIFDENNQMGAASQWWLAQSLRLLNAELKGQLTVYFGDPIAIIKKIVVNENIVGVFWNHVYEPSIMIRNESIKNDLIENGILVETINAALLSEPWQGVKADGSPYQIFAPFMKNLTSHVLQPRRVLPKPSALVTKKIKGGDTVDAISFLTKNNWSHKLSQYWQPGEMAALSQLKTFLEASIHFYAIDRDYPAKPAISRLSPYLHFGELSPNQVWYAVKQLKDKKNGNAFLRQLIWREFAYHLLYYFPSFPSKNWREQFDQFPWQKNKKLLDAWKKGITGYPIVDAGMRELWETGFMHNRVRMITASFLVKHCLVDWRLGAAHFFDCLVDADLASNSVNWQWVAGSGVDAAPFFRIFNPILQAKKFDSKGAYIRRFIPEIAALPNRYLFAPWEAPASVLERANIKLGMTYPKPILDLQTSRERALLYYQKIK